MAITILTDETKRRHKLNRVRELIASSNIVDIVVCVTDGRAEAIELARALTEQERFRVAFKWEVTVEGYRVAAMRLPHEPKITGVEVK